MGTIQPDDASVTHPAVLPTEAMTAPTPIRIILFNVMQNLLHTRLYKQRLRNGKLHSPVSK